MNLEDYMTWALTTTVHCTVVVKAQAGYALYYICTDTDTADVTR